MNFRSWLISRMGARPWPMVGVLVVGLAAVPASNVTAQLLTYEGFDYTLGSDLTNNVATGSGWGEDAWTVNAMDFSAVITSAMSFSTLETSGNALDMEGVTALYNVRRADRKMGLAEPLTNGTLWVSYVYKDSDGSEDEYNDIDVVFAGAVRMHMKTQKQGMATDTRPGLSTVADADLEADLVLGNPGANITDGTKYLLVGMFELGVVNGTCGLWILDESDFEAIDPDIRAGTVSTNDLGNHSYLHGTVNVSDSITVATNDTVILFLFPEGYVGPVETPDMTIDELRFGLSLTSVVPVQAQLTGSAGDHGSVTPATTNVLEGNSATFTISAHSGFHIATISSNGVLVGSYSDDALNSTNYTWSNVQGDGALSATFAVDSSGALLTYEGFDYTLGSDLTNNVATGSGWGEAAWHVNNADLSAVIVGPTNFSTLKMSGNALDMESPATLWAGRTAFRNMGLAEELNSGTLWVSYVYKDSNGSEVEYNSVEVILSTNTTFRMQMKTQKQAGLPDARPALSMDGDLEGDLVLGNPGANITDGTKYLLVGMFELGVANGTCGLWILEESDFEAIDPDIRARTVSTNDLGDHSYLHGTAALADSITVQTNDRVQFFVMAGSDPIESADMTIDELRFGLTLRSVLPLQRDSGSMLVVR